MKILYHYFVSSFASFAVGQSVQDATRQLRVVDKGVCTGCNVFLVPVSIDEDYKINFYQPQVAGTKFCGFYDYKKGFDFEHLLIAEPNADDIEVDEVEEIQAKSIAEFLTCEHSA